MGRVRKTKRPRKHHSLGKELAGCGTTPQPRNVPCEHKLAVDSGLPAQEHTDVVVNDECGSTPPKSKAASQLESLEDRVLSSSLELKAKELARNFCFKLMQLTRLSIAETYTENHHINSLILTMQFFPNCIFKKEK